MISIHPLLEFFQPVFLFDIFDLFDDTDSIGVLVGIIVILIIYGLIKANARSMKVVHSHWHHMFDSRPFTPEEFYQALEQEIMEREIDKAGLSRITHSEGGIVISASRTYLRVRFREYKIDICAAPFAKEAFFVSWWLGGEGLTFCDVLISIPFIGRLFSRREKTFYELDTEIMFKEMIAGCVKQTIEGLTQTKGLRMPEGIDWNSTSMQYNSK